MLERRKIRVILNNTIASQQSTFGGFFLDTTRFFLVVDVVVVVVANRGNNKRGLFAPLNINDRRCQPQYHHHGDSAMKDNHGECVWNSAATFTNKEPKQMYMWSMLWVSIREERRSGENRAYSKPTLVRTGKSGESHTCKFGLPSTIAERRQGLIALARSKSLCKVSHAGRTHL
jgi:hypothetical protein